jgi:hypothetical protein
MTAAGVTVGVTGGVTVGLTGVGVRVGVGVGAGVGRDVGVGRGRGVGVWRGGTVTLVGPGTGVDPGLPAFGGVAPGADPGTGTTSVLSVGSYDCPDEESGGPAALPVAPAGVVPRGAARSFRLPCCTWRPTASTCDEPTGELEPDGEAGRSTAEGLAVPEDGTERTIICGGPGGLQALPRPRKAAARKMIAAVTATMEVFTRIPPTRTSVPHCRAVDARTRPVGRN